MDIQLNPNPQQDEPTIDLGSGKGFNIPSQAAASGTAAKASFGLGNLMGVPYDDFYSSIANGQEPQMREQAAATADASVAKRKQSLVTQAVATGQNPSPILTEPKTTDPDSVVEEYAASKYFQPMLDSTDVDKTVQANADAINAGVNNLTYKNYAITRLQKSLDGYKNESWTDWTEDQIKSLSQFYTEWKTRGGTGDLTKLLGSDLEEQRQKAYSMPFDQYKQWLDQRMDQLDKDNPTLALAFGAAIVGQSNYAIDQDNATTLLGIPSDLSVVGGLAADVYKSVRAVRAAVQGVVKSSDIIDPKTAEALDKATNLGSNVNVNGKPWNSNPKDITPEDIKQAQAAGHGNQGDAAIQTVSKYITNTFEQKENVTQEVKSLPAIFKTDIDSVTQNTGNLGNDIANRIKEQFLQRGLDITGALTELLRVNRIPVAVASEDFAKAAREWVKGKYSGANSTVLDGSGSNILLDAPSNTYHVNINIGNHDNEYFKNEAEAVSHAEQYGLGLQEPPTSERQYWDDEATAAAFEVDHIKTQLKKYEGYTKQQFKPQKYFELQKRLKEQNARKKNAWAQRAGAYWKPNQPISEKLGKVTLEKQGLGWYIQGWVPLDETATFARDALLKMPDAYSGPRGLSGKVRSGTLTPYLQDLVTGTESNRLLASAKVWLDQPFGEKIEPLTGLRSPEETLSPEENIQRKVATHTPGALADRIFGPDAKTVQSIPKKYTGDIKRLLIANQNMIDPVTSEHGYFFKNIGDVEDWYQNNTGRFPSAEEVEGYFAYTRMYETERVLRTMAMLRNKWRSGVESWKVKIGKEWTSEFDAVKRTELPTAFEKSPVYIAIDGGDVVKASGQYTKELRERFAQGKVQVLELWNPEDRPFHEHSSELKFHEKSGSNHESRQVNPRYVITDQANTRPISPENQVPRRGGGHWVFPYDHYVRQANTYLDPVTKQWVYRGDTVAMPFQNVALGRKWAMKMNEVQNLMREGMIDDAREFVKNLGVGGLNFDDHIWPMFKPVGDKPARFNMHEPFVLTPTDKTVMSLSNELKDRYEDKGGLLDTTRYGNMARNHTVEFTGERDAHDLHTIEDSGTTRNPVYSYRPAQFADPIDVLNRGITRISNSLWLDDMKYFSSEHWYKTYENWLDTDKGGSPFYHFINPIWKEGVPTGVKELAMSNRKKAMEFVRQYSPLANWARKNMAEAVGAIYNVAGPKAYNMFRPLEELVSEKNPVSALRSLTADIKIGLGSLPAFFMQASAYANIAALEPRFVGAATRAMMLDVYAEFIPQHIDHLDSLASANLGGLTRQVGFNPGHFKHLWEGLNKSDFRHVGSEHAFMNFALSDRYMKSFHDSLRYWGSTAFREGAQGVRRGAWYTSGLKWIEDNEGRLPQTRDDWAKIMDYAGMLDHNMSRASNSAINSGMMSVPAQFYTYDRNIAEIMWGKRVTPQQKARLFVTSSILWGLPYGGLGLLGLPLGYEAYKNYSEYAKYVPGYNTVESMAVEGLLSYLGAKATGKGDPRKGTWYDFSRYGVKGWGLLAGLFSDDSRWWTLLGAAPSAVINTVSRMSPLMGDLAGLMHGINTSEPAAVPGVGPVPGQGGDFSKFNPAAEDFADLMKEWVGFNQGHKLWVALRSQIQMSNNNTPIRDNVTTGQAITNFFTGLVPANVEGISADWGILSDRKAQQQLIVSQMSRNYNLALKEARENPDLANNSAYQAYMRKMKIILDMAPLTEQGNIMHEVYSRNKPLIEAIEDQMHKKMAGPEDQERFRKQIEMRNLQGEE